MDISLIEERRRNRLRLLHAIYGNSVINKVKAVELAFELGIRNGKYEEAISYLTREGLIEGDKVIVTITHNGIKVVENAVLNPKEGNDLFPPLNEVL